MYIRICACCCGECDEDREREEERDENAEEKRNVMCASMCRIRIRRRGEKWSRSEVETCLFFFLFFPAICVRHIIH
jgi:hypothetical protein